MLDDISDRYFFSFLLFSRTESRQRSGKKKLKKKFRFFFNFPAPPCRKTVHFAAVWRVAGAALLLDDDQCDAQPELIERR